MRELETPSAEIAEGKDVGTSIPLHAKDGAGRDRTRSRKRRNLH